MQALLYASAFLLICLGVAVMAAIPWLLSKAKYWEELAMHTNVATQMAVNRYNSTTAPSRNPTPPTPGKPKGPNIYPLNRGKNGPGKNDDNLR